MSMLNTALGARVERNRQLLAQIIGELANKGIIKPSRIEITEHRPAELKLYVVGLPDNQAARIKHLVDGVPARVVTFPPEAPMRTTMTDADHVYVCKTAKAAWTTMVKQHHPGRYTFHDGSVDALGRRMRQLVVEALGLTDVKHT